MTERPSWRQRLRRSTAAPSPPPEVAPRTDAPAAATVRVHLLGPASEVVADARWQGTRTVTAAEVLERATGWEQRPGRGWCAGDRCAPGAGTDAEVDPADVAERLGAPSVAWAGDGEAALAIAQPADVVDAPLASGALPRASGVDLAGEVVALERWSGQRRALLLWASWCGCRHDLPAWEAIHRDLVAAEPGATVVAIAVDESADAVAPWAEGTTFPLLLDPQRTICEALGVVNVPTVIWVDEHDRIVRSHAQVFGDNSLIEHHGVDSLPHHEALRRWARDDGPPPDPEAVPAHVLPHRDAQAARAQFRLAAWLLRTGRNDDASVHLDEAARLAPDDLTIRRAAIALRGGDPFGEEFFALYEDWKPRTGGLSYLPPPAPR